MVKTGKNIILSASILAIALTSIYSQAFAEDNKNAIIPKESRIIFNIMEKRTSLSSRELESITAKVISLDINVDKEQKSYIIRCLGSLTNRSNLLLKNIKLTVQLMDINKNMIEEIPIDYIDRADPGQEKPFKIEKYISTKSSPYEIRAKAIISEVEKTDAMQITQWFLAGKSEMLKYWDIPFNEKEVQNGSMLRNSAIKILTGISRNDLNYPKAMDMANELRYTEGLIALSSADFNNAFFNLIAINPENKLSNKAEKLLEIYRHQTVFEKAKSFYPQKDYFKALSLLRTIPQHSEFYFEAQRELTKLYFLTRTSLPKKSILDFTGYTEDQVRVLQLMENKPDVILTDSPVKNQTIWVFTDYSHFYFDEYGKLLSYRVYPLY